METAQLVEQYAALTTRAGMVDFDDITHVELTGDDRSSLLHNLCTNEIRKLPSGAGCEAFLLNVQGKILFFVQVFSQPDALVLSTEPGEGARLIAHLDRYLIREKVTLADRSSDRAEMLLAGSQSSDVLTNLGAARLPGVRLESIAAKLDAGASWMSVWLRRFDLIGEPAYLVDCQRADFSQLRSLLIAAGVMPCSRQAYECLRIEAGLPAYGSDITVNNLPQEVDRDAKAISFVKGCYLGQETVARIDALGHVNRKLRGVRFSGQQIPLAGAELRSGDQVVGQVTSATFSPRLNAPLALAYLRRGHEMFGTKLDSECGAAEVVSLPLAD